MSYYEKWARRWKKLLVEYGLRGQMKARPRSLRPDKPIGRTLADAESQGPLARKHNSRPQPPESFKVGEPRAQKGTLKKNPHTTARYERGRIGLIEACAAIKCFTTAPRRQGEIKNGSYDLF